MYVQKTVQTQYIDFSLSFAFNNNNDIPAAEISHSQRARYVSTAVRFTAVS